MIRFVVDSRLERLARDLRLLGVDASCMQGSNREEREALLDAARNEGRTVLSADPALCEAAPQERGYCVETTGRGEQLLEVLRRFSLVEAARVSKGFLTRCLQCNRSILPAHPHQVAHLVSGAILTSFDHFYFCPRCERAYWKSAHWDRLRKWTQDLLDSAPRPTTV